MSIGQLSHFLLTFLLPSVEKSFFVSKNISMLKLDEIFPFQTLKLLQV